AAPGVAVTVTDGVTVSPERTTDVRGRYCWTGLKGDTWYTATARTPEGLFAAAGRRIAAGTAAEARLTLTKR
ncbi:MAG: hypothetical protein QG597_2561, partial [Actinomycetota bacterium]|nr:hypothetical protein [Actinomycetota bacterium]